MGFNDWLVMLQALSSVKYLSDCKLVNNDFKPENYVVFNDGDTKELTGKMIDYDGAVPIDANGMPCNRCDTTGVVT